MKADHKPKQKTGQKPVRNDEPTWPLMAAGFVVLLGLYLIFSAMRGNESVEEESNPRQAEIDRHEKIEYYKRQLGEKLNRSRTIAEHELVKEAYRPKRAFQQASGYRASVDGLPLDYESVTYAPRENSKRAEIYFPDHRVAYDLQDEQRSDFWVEEAQRKFLREYLLKARAQGYDLAIDTNYNVIVKKAPKRLAQNQRMPQNAMEPFVQLKFSSPFFSPPPFCH